MGITYNPFVGNFDITGSSSTIDIGSTPVTGGADNQVLYNDGGTVGGIGPLTDGQLIIGATGSDPVAGSITGSSSITVTPGAGTIAVTVPAGGITNTEVAAGIDATKIGAGLVNNTEFSYISTVSSNVQDQLDSKIPLTQKGAANGVATLDGGGKIPAGQLPNSVMELQGFWNANTNTPTLTDGTGNPGDVWEVDTAGTTDFGSGPITFAVGDWAVYAADGKYHKSLNSNAVTSVNGMTGTVVLDTDDINEGGTNLYFTNVRAQNAITGAASSVVTADLNPNHATISNGSGKLAASVTTSTELSYVSGVTSSIQDQFDALTTMQAQKDEFTLDSTDITNQYVDLSQVLFPATERFTFLGVVQRLGSDYSVSLTGGAGGNTRVSFTPGGDLATGSPLALVAGDIITIQYLYAMGMTGGGGTVSSVNGQTGVVVLTKADIGLGNVDNTSDANKPVSTATQAALDLKQDLIVETANSFAGFDGAGLIESVPGFAIDTFSAGMRIEMNQAPNNDVGGYNVHSDYNNFRPLQDSNSQTWNIRDMQVNLDPDSDGFSMGYGGDAFNAYSTNIQLQGTSDVGRLAIHRNNFNIGNGTDPVSVTAITQSYGFGQINDNVTVDGQVQGYGFQMNASSASIFNDQWTAFYDYSNIQSPVPGYTSFIANPVLAEITNNRNYMGFTTGPNITTLTGNAQMTGLGVFPNIGTVDVNGGFNGVMVSPNITTNKNYAVGVNVNMNGVTNDPGAKASLTVQDIKYERNIATTDGNNLTVEYEDTVTAGSEVAILSGGNHIIVSIESGVSTATQVLAALTANFTLSANLTFTITGVASNPQVTYAQTNLSGGINPGRKQAGFFGGDVEIQGSLSFTGALSVGQINAFASKDLATTTPGVNSIDSFITAPSVAANTTVSGVDILGINTAMLLTLGDNAVLNSNFLGIAALGLPAVVSMGTGSTVDRVEGAIFAISLDSGATGGTIGEVNLTRALAVPNGATTVTKLKAFAFDLPFGDPGATTWGTYIEPTCNNYMAGNLMIGGTAGSVDTVTNSSVGLELNSTTKAILSSRMTTTQKNALTAVAGMVVFDTTLNQLSYYNGTTWVNI